MFSRTLCVLVFLVTLVFVSHADDAYVENLGGAVYLMKGHPTIRMVSEEVHMKAITAEVTADFVFRNEGPATKVLMGFPEGRPEVGKTIFSYYQTWVDGKPIKARILPTKRDSRKFDLSIDWRVKEVAFAKGQTRRVRVKYKSTPFPIDVEDENGDTGPYQANMTLYVLQTGASWKGKIGRVRVICDLTGIQDTASVSADPEPTRKSARLLVWEYRNMEPTKESDITVSWDDAFTNILVDGINPFQDPIYRTKDEKLIWDQDGDRPPFLQGNDLFIPVRALESWTSTTIRFDRDNNQVILSRNGRSLTYINGRSQTVKAQDVAVPIVYKEGNSYISVFAGAKALGFSARWTGNHESLEIKNE